MSTTLKNNQILLDVIVTNSPCINLFPCLNEAPYVFNKIFLHIVILTKNYT